MVGISRAAVLEFGVPDEVKARSPPISSWSSRERTAARVEADVDACHAARRPRRAGRLRAPVDVGGAHRGPGARLLRRQGGRSRRDRRRRGPARGRRGLPARSPRSPTPTARSSRAAATSATATSTCRCTCPTSSGARALLDELRRGRRHGRRGLRRARDRPRRQAALSWRSATRSSLDPAADQGGLRPRRHPQPRQAARRRGRRRDERCGVAALDPGRGQRRRRCFMNPGTSEMHFVAALDDVPGVRGVLCLFEGVASGAADGYARVAGWPAATLFHLGPGLGNAFANLHNAAARARPSSTSSATTRPTTRATTRRSRRTSPRSPAPLGVVPPHRSRRRRRRRRGRRDGGRRSARRRRHARAPRRRLVVADDHGRPPPRPSGATAQVAADAVDAVAGPSARSAPRSCWVGGAASRGLAAAAAWPRDRAAGCSTRRSPRSSTAARASRRWSGWTTWARSSSSSTASGYRAECGHDVRGLGERQVGHPPRCQPPHGDPTRGHRI